VLRSAWDKAFQASRLGNTKIALSADIAMAAFNRPLSEAHPAYCAYSGDINRLSAALSTNPTLVNQLYEFWDESLTVSDEESNNARTKSYIPPPLVPDRVRSALSVRDVTKMTLDQRWLIKFGFMRSTLLHYACAGDQLDTVKLLVSLGASKEIQNGAGRFPEYYAMNDSVLRLIWSTRSAAQKVSPEKPSTSASDLKHDDFGSHFSKGWFPIHKPVLIYSPFLLVLFRFAARIWKRLCQSSG
jgi:hypothetical protein